MAPEPRVALDHWEIVDDGWRVNRIWARRVDAQIRLVDCRREPPQDDPPDPGMPGHLGIARIRQRDRMERWGSARSCLGLRAGAEANGRSPVSFGDSAGCASIRWSPLRRTGSRRALRPENVSRRSEIHFRESRRNGDYL